MCVTSGRDRGWRLRGGHPRSAPKGPPVLQNIITGRACTGFGKGTDTVATTPRNSSRARNLFQPDKWTRGRDQTGPSRVTSPVFSAITFNFLNDRHANSSESSSLFINPGPFPSKIISSPFSEIPDGSIKKISNVWAECKNDFSSLCELKLDFWRQGETSVFVASVELRLKKDRLGVWFY